MQAKVSILFYAKRAKSTSDGLLQKPLKVITSGRMKVISCGRAKLTSARRGKLTTCGG